MPQGIESNLQPEALLAALLHLTQRDVDLSGEPPTKETVMALQAAAAITSDLLRPAMAAFLMLPPEALHTTAADPEALGNLADSLTFFPSPRNTLTQILTQWSHVTEVTLLHPIRLSKSKML